MKKTITMNLHTHTHLCKHAVGTVYDYCKAAFDKKINILGISDHVPFPDNRWINERMDITELPLYCQELDQAIPEFPQMEILKALECEYVREYDSFYREELLGRWQFDYLIGAVHFIPLNGEWLSLYQEKFNASHLIRYARYFIESMESGLFLFMAHPDLFGYAYWEWDKNAEACARDILEAASKLKMPLEINGNGFRKSKIQTSQGLRLKYPLLKFWELAAEYDIRVLANSDAHSPEEIDGNIRDAMEIGDMFQLQFAELKIGKNGERCSF